jgi:hypothetical protein
MRLKSLSARVTVPEFILNGRLATPAILTGVVAERRTPSLLRAPGAEFHPHYGAGTGA